VRALELLGDDVELGARPRQRGVTPELADDAQVGVAGVVERARAEAHRLPEARLARRIGEARRHHADDDEGLAVERDRLAEGPAVAAEPALPQPPRQEHRARGVAAVVVGRERAAERGLGAEQRQHVGGQGGALETLRLVVADEVRRYDRRRAHGLEGAAAALPGAIVGRRQLRMAAAGELPLPQDHQARRVGVRQRAHQHVVGERERRRVGADAERRYQHHRHREAGRTPQAAQRVAHVLLGDVPVQQRGRHQRIAGGGQPQ
jgi:hypothetical protein